jgi:hypothetical protein
MVWLSIELFDSRQQCQSESFSGLGHGLIPEFNLQHHQESIVSENNLTEVTMSTREYRISDSHKDHTLLKSVESYVVTKSSFGTSLKLTGHLNPFLSGLEPLN